MALQDELAILCIDAQPEFFRGMQGEEEPVLARLERLFRFARFADLPLIATFEEPVARKGWLPERLERAFPEHGLRFLKSAFDALAEKPVRVALKGLGRKAIAVAGAETDVCVLFTVLSLLGAGYTVHLLEDCCFTSARDAEPALRRMEAAGAIPTTFKTLAYEVTATVDRSAWPAEWRERADLFPPPEEA